MSAALVRRGLELLSADISEGADKKKNKNQQGMKNKKQQGMKNKKQQGMKATRSKRSSKAPAGHNRTTAIDCRMRSMLEEASRGRQKEKTAVTLQYFLHSGASASGEHAAKIVRQNLGRQSKNKVEAPAQKPQEPKSIFTEEEFQQFQKEYFGRTVEEQ